MRFWHFLAVYDGNRFLLTCATNGKSTVCQKRRFLFLTFVVVTIVPKKYRKTPNVILPRKSKMIVTCKVLFYVSATILDLYRALIIRREEI